jgi:hypothetical protein
LAEEEKAVVAESILFVSTLALISELVVLCLLIFGYSQKRMMKYRKHGIIMTTAVPLHLATITWMVWSLIVYLRAASLNLGTLLALVTVAHVTLGIMAVSLGAWLVMSWHLQKNIQKCFARKRIMRTTIILWPTAILLGIVLYIAVILS